MTDADPESTAAEPTDSVAPARSRWRPGVVGILHAVALLTFVALLKYEADRWAWATVLAYSPRWPWLAPGALATFVALLRNRRPWLTAIVTLVAGVWLLDAHLNWPRSPIAGATHLKIVTLNADGGGTAGRGIDPLKIAALLAAESPDIVCLQEWVTSEPPPLPPGDWTVRQFRNQVIASRLPIEDTVTVAPEKLLGDSSLLGCRLTLPNAGPGGRSVWVFTPHLETPRRGFTHLLAGKSDGFALTTHLARRRMTVSLDAIAFIRSTAGEGAGEGSGEADVLVAGDFNLIADGAIFRATWARFADAFESAGNGTGGTKLQTGWRPRIDHILTGTGWQPLVCRVGPDVGSDHLPLIAEIERR